MYIPKPHPELYLTKNSQKVVTKFFLLHRPFLRTLERQELRWKETAEKDRWCSTPRNAGRRSRRANCTTSPVGERAIFRSTRMDTLQSIRPKNRPGRSI